MSITWTKNGDNKYLVESKEHLLQIMNQGSLYTDMGDHPTDYWESDYLQTVDIDLANDHANIVPIGIFSNAFGGEYDGGRFQISNVSHSGTGHYVGLFGNVQQAVIKHIRLSGVWTMSGGSSSTGCLAGYAYSTTVIDVEGNFEAGTVVSGSGTHVGGLFGNVSSNSNIHVITLRGTLEFQADAASNVGGVFGTIAYATMDLCRNLATIPGGINGGDVGGICGQATSNFSLSKCLNAMQGDLTGSNVGGICGDFKYGRYDYDSLVNSMVGNISSSGNAGGIFGVMDVHDDSLYSCTKLLNYMKGDVVGSTGSGGIVGSMSRVNNSGDVSRVGNYQITKSIVAMQGNVEQAVRGAETFTPSQVEVTVDTSFGMTFTDNDYASATMVVDDALVYNSGFTDLPYIDLSGTDTEGNVYPWDFVYANIGGKAAYDDYTHLSVHKAQVSAPFYTDYGLPESNSVVYLTYAHVEENSVYIDTSLTIVETTADVAFDHGKSAVVYATPDPSASAVTWTKNGSDQYLVESTEHLLQIMSRGKYFSDAGTPPTDYWSSSYLQTADIDLQNEHARIVPIGYSSTECFSGEYDGGLFQIKNWAYAGTATSAGLFGICWEGGVLKHIRLSGTWTLPGSLSLRSGFLVGYIYKVSVYDVEANFDVGTAIQGIWVGVLIGRNDHSPCHLLTLRGTVDSVEGTDIAGGLVGYLGGGLSQFEHCRNLATFPTGINSVETGGIVGRIHIASISKCLNAMQGDLNGSYGAGGICGYSNWFSTSDSLVNSMVGNVSSTSFAGGIFGRVNVTEGNTLVGTRLLNYMKGGVVGPNGAGGILGTCTVDSGVPGDIEITKSVVAMQGNVAQSVRGTEDFTPSVLEVTVDTSFGMTFTENDYGSATMVVDNALVYDSSFTDLPYIDMSGTDTEGNVYPWDFVYANIGGKAAYDDYTHLSVHKAQVSAPFYTDYGLPESNSVVYLTFANVDENSVYIDSNLTVIDTAAALVFDKATLAVSVAWPKNHDGKYLVKSKQQLLQIMNQGALFTDAGSAPTDYWASSYLQTSDIDLANDHANIVPIGNAATYFTGDYDGGLFQIKNWGCTTASEYGGLFGYAFQADLTRIRLTGVWTLLGQAYYSGFFCARPAFCNISDIEADFDEGTQQLSDATWMGGLIGSIAGGTFTGITLKGFVDFGQSLGSRIGGIAGYMWSGAVCTAWRNLATFPNGIQADVCGGISAYMSGGNASNWINSMKGDVSGRFAGGIVGYMTTSNSLESIANVMTGNIISSNHNDAGGIIAYCATNCSASATKLLNYMNGDIIADSTGGGIVGNIVSNDITITKSVVAMHGSVDQSVRGAEGTTTLQFSHFEVSVDASFGMVFDGNDYGSSTMVVDDALVYHPDFTDLPYFDLGGTDYDWDFVYANIGGKAAYDDYTHLSVHKSQVSAPFYTDYGLTDSNNVVYLTYANVEENTVYIDSNLTVIDTAAAFIVDKATLAFALAWTKNNDEKYLVKSKQHLLQIMNQGSSYTNAGDTPTDYWASSYLQTSDIDLANDHASIVPIGDSAAAYFTGEYDGGLFAIKNWSYTGTQTSAGLFGDCNGASLKRVRLSGVWTMDAYESHSGFLCGAFAYSTAHDIEGDFSEGTLLTGGGASSGCSGALFGYVGDSSVYGASVLGTVNFMVSNDAHYRGGVIGRSSTSTLSHVRNLASCPDGIYGLYVGGIVGYLNDSTLSNSLNGMNGDVQGKSNSGGLVGRVYRSSLDLVANSMTGIVRSSHYHAGGIIGYTDSHSSTNFVAGTRMVNYMHGDIEGLSSSGGLVGYTYGRDDMVDTFTKCIVAMQGNADQAVRGGGNVTPAEMEATVDTSFGMSFTSNDYGSATMVVDDAFVYAPGFADLPYIDLTGTDPDGNVYEWEFSFANMGGKFDHYTHLSVHTAQVLTPFRTDFGLADDNDVVYLTYANLEENSLYIDSNLSIVETTADIAFDFEKSAIVYGTPDPPTTLAWTRNVDGKFEVATTQHLLQLMSEGTMYTDLGDHPRDYWGSAYIQTSDIDLVNDHASIAPIGNDNTNFTGEYDGGRFAIKNWAYSGQENRTGLFGYISDAALRHIRLSGVWVLSSPYDRGFLVGRGVTSTIYDIDTDFSEGTEFLVNSVYTCGTVIGYADQCDMRGLSVRGTISFHQQTAQGSAGGIVGYTTGSTLDQCRNIATFPTGINGYYAGGIIGQVGGTGVFGLSHCLNGMRGDLLGAECGGIIGRCGIPTWQLDLVVNSMTGNMSGSAIAGGIIGLVYMLSDNSLYATGLLNYMKGDIESRDSSNPSGGILGEIIAPSDFPGADALITKSIVAMQGTVDQSILGVVDNFVPSQVEVTVDTSFGVTYSGNEYGSATMVVDDALVYHPDFTDLPYIDLSGTDPDGTEYDWNFLYANMGGKFHHYTHLSVHTSSEVLTPIYTDFGLVADNDVVYLTYANVGENSLYIDSNLSIVETAADIAFDFGKTAVVYGTPDPLETLVWTKDGDGKFEVSSIQHMLQLMSEGTMYTDLGDHPRDYWGSAYKQTSDIDLANDHASIVPIGNLATSFTGEYDGGLFKIQNWSYAAVSEHTGLFGICEDASIKRIRLSGVWTLSANGFSSGFLCGSFKSSTVYDVEGSFDEGTSLGGDSAGGDYGATLIASASSATVIHGLTVRGSVAFGASAFKRTAGAVGHLGGFSSLTQCQNKATFPNGIPAELFAGGIVAVTSQGILSNISNEMNGGIVSPTGCAGGIVGNCLVQSEMDSVVNSMEGNIQAAEYAGGVVGYLYSGSAMISVTRVLNYMKGDVLAPDGAGGLVGYVGQITGDLSITKSIVAMQGNVEQSVRGVETFSPSAMEVTVDPTFGMFFDMNDYGSATMVVDDALVYHSDFTDLPYIDLSGTDPDGTEYKWDFLYANIGGKYDQYTHLSVHTTPEILVPLPTTLGAVGVDSVYLTYANADEKSLYIDPSLTIVETTADVVFDHAKSVVIHGTPTPATSVLWTQDADGKFEVATKQHLLQIMNQGVLYTDLGVVRPSSYWTHHYVQTAEIDLENDTTYFVCIGDEDTSFVGSFEHDGFEVLNWEHEGHTRLFGDRTTLMWTQDAEGRYEVATVQHLLQIMENGQRFVNEGDFPADHWGASASYVQTADIDLIDWHAKIHPIGNATTNFSGQYDGGGHKISNWSYTQPEDSATVSATGLFGAVTNAEIKHLCLDGVWTLSGSAHSSTYLGDGFLCGSATASTVYDVESKWEVGTLMAGGSSTTAPLTHRVGCLIGLASDSVVCNVTLGGTVDMKDFGAEGNTYVGGVIGYVLNAGSSVTLCRNVATFPNGITGNTVGGLVSYFHMGSLNQCINAMQGDVVGITHAGGVCGVHVNGGSCEGLANSMTGNIQATDNAGGIHGCVDASLVVSSSQLMNYMSGNVQGTHSGGVVGLVKRSVETGDVSVTNSIVAMNGSVSQPIGGSLQFEPSAIEAAVNSEFGMVYQKQIVAERTLTNFTTNPSFTDLPYIALVAADPDGATQSFDFVFANLGGSFVYAGLFTHLSLHTTAVSAPLATDYGLDLSNTHVYLTYANLAKSEIFVDDALTIVETAAEIAFNHAKSVVVLGNASLPLICEPRALTIRASIDALGVPFQLTYQQTSKNSREIVAHHNFLETTKVISGLSPETTYVIRLYVNEVLAEHVLVTTAANSVENYVVSDFFNVEEELYDISNVADKVSGVVVNELFTTGDVVEVDMGFARKTTMETTFVKKGELVEVERSGAVLLPFETNGESQESTIQLSDTTSVQVGLDQASGDISVGGNLYKSGKSFVIDGRKCTVFDI